MSHKKDIHGNGTAEKGEGTQENNHKKLPDQALREFSGNDASFYIQKKSERIVAALYVVTDSFPSTDPVCSRLREMAVLLLGLSRKSHENLSSQRMLASLFRDLVSVWNLAYYASFVSETNFDILKREIRSVLQILVLETEKGATGPELLEEYFQVPALPSSESGPDEGSLAEDFYKGQNDRNHWDDDDQWIAETRQFYKRQKEEDGKTSDEAFDSLESGEGKSQIHTSNAARALELKRAPELSKNISNNPVKLAISSIRKKKTTNGQRRRESILRVIEKKGKVGIKDISFAVNGCSEKTLQRELIDMVSSGIIKKEGERRWSRYSLS